MNRLIRPLFFVCMVFPLGGAQCLSLIPVGDICEQTRLQNPDADNGTMSATTDGNAFEACMTTGALSDGNGAQVLTVTGQAFGATAGESMQLAISIVDPVLGENALGGDVAANLGRWTADVSNTYVTTIETTGNVNLTRLDDTGAAGTFSFTAMSDSGTVEVTNGAFDVTFP